MNQKGPSPEEMHHLVEKDIEQSQQCWVHSGALGRIRRSRRKEDCRRDGGVGAQGQGQEEV